MKIYLRYIFITLAATLMAISCIEELELATPTVHDDVVTFVPRVQSFANRYVTKSDYIANETKISKHTVMVFNNEGRLVYKESAQGNSPFRLNKSMLNSAANGDLTQATVVMLANMEYADINNSGTTVTRLSDFESCTYKPSTPVITSIPDSFAGFPMIGGIKGVNLTSTKEQQSALEIGLKILYAKVNFQISVEQGVENQNVGSGMQFALTECSIHNAATSTSIAIPASKGTPAVDFLGDAVSETNATADGATASANYTGSAATSVGKTGTAKLDGDKINFTFYVLESRYNHGSDLRGIYPNDSWLASTSEEDVKNYNANTDAGKLNGVKYPYDDLIQQYKPNLAATSTGNPKGKATYVLLKGTYTDYRGVAWKVDYKLYLGKDNAHNFHVDRNSEYTNHIAIKGIRNRQDGAYGENDVWIDHRVNVTYNGSGADDYVTITRETLLDAHIEVRPLRVKWAGNEYDGVRVYLPTESNGNLINWIGIERFTGNNCQDGSTYCLIKDKENAGKQKSSGKRKYFTTDLISELQSMEGEYGVREDEDTKKKYIYLLNEDCAWIYFDENIGASDREAEIKLEFYKKSGSTQNVVYKVKQRCLQTVASYAIESYEEYLHSYDSEDKYDLSTSPVDYTQQGLVWGFQDHKLSQNILVSNSAVLLDATKTEMFKQYSYDYFHASDGANYYLYKKTSGSWGSASFGTGLYFTDCASANRDIAVKDMGTMPENAYQYCLSKNKFEVVGLNEVKMTLNWYLPDPYEMQAILDASQSSNSPVDIDPDSYYWSSQPSFDTELYRYINEDIENARAVSSQGITDLKRESKNRIRCIYAKQGIPLDEEAMEERVPDGIGGNYNVVMKAWNKGSYGYFNFMLPDSRTETSSTEWEYNTTETEYPNADNGSSISGEKFHYLEVYDKDNKLYRGFDINPNPEGDKANSWTPYVFNYIIGSRTTDYYTTLYSFPGLSPNTMKQFDVATYINEIGLNLNLGNITVGPRDAYKETTTPKSGTQKDTSRVVKELDKKLSSASDLKEFDHLTGGSMINISFDKSQGESLPVFAYDELVSGTATTNTRNWIIPEYNLTKYSLNPEEYTKEAGGVGSEEGVSTGTSALQQASIEDAKKNAFDGTRVTSTLTSYVEGAYPKAKNDAKAKLDEILKAYPVSEGWEHLPIKYTELSWNDQVPNIQWSEPDTRQSGLIIKYYSRVKITCTVTVTASVTVKKPSVGEIFIQAEGTGRWSDPIPNPKHLTPSINTDELRMYCGNSFTISLSEEAKQQGYEITKVKVHYSGDNYIGEYDAILGLGGNNVYARFVDNELNLSDYELPNQPIIGSTEVLQLPGMDYSADGATGWHQWTGEGRNSITLLLADYNVNYNKSSITYTYNYDSSPQKPGKYIIVDQIDVKCAKRKNAQFDFKKIYAENGNTETSDWTVKHIIFRGEAASADGPVPGASAEGLKLYAGSKVTFKALDGYVINSISGDSALTFKGSQQIVEFTDLPEKTISSEITVLYSKVTTD